MAIRIPTNITVHLGPPASDAPNITVPFTDYIKNVVSSEIYPTWPTESLKANILAILSFTLNRIYTEYYRSRGYDFDITNSTAYDQIYIPGREIYGTINTLVDEFFDSYIVRENQVQPLAAQYCSGTDVTCDGLSQWGSVDLALSGLTNDQIISNYYGDDTDIVYDAPVAQNVPSYPGVPLRLGTFSEEVRTIQRELNRIALNYPAIPKVEVNEGIFNGATQKSVIEFQKIFNLVPDGIVGKATWYKLKYIYNSVKKLSEIFSEGITIGESERFFNKVYKKGDSGLIVKEIQFFLDFFAQFNKNLQRVKIDGIFGPQTEEALKKFQSEYGLTVDGLSGVKTWYKFLTEYSKLIAALPEGYRTFDTPLFPGYLITSGTSGEIVRELQTYLRVIAQNDSRVPLIKVDGSYGPSTTAAVEAVQALSDLPTVGEVGALTWNAILTLYNLYASSDTPLNPGSSITSGSTGEKVRELQTYLHVIAQNDSRVPLIKVDGFYGPRTIAAVKAVQALSNLATDGEVGPLTWNAILDLYNSYTSSDTPPYPGYTISSGSTGEKVKEIQKYLRVIAENDNRVPMIKADGFYGPRTKAAVKAVQALSGLATDGVVGPLTWNAILDLYNTYT